MEFGNGRSGILRLGRHPGALLATWPDIRSESHVGSLGDQPPADGSGTCSLHRFTRALRCVCTKRPAQRRRCSRARERGSNSRTVRGPPPVPLVRVASLRSSPLGLLLGRLTGTGSASMPTLRSVNHREPFSFPVAGLLTDLIRVISAQACNGPASLPRLGQQSRQVPRAWVCLTHV